jgi:hypothetical protein
MALLRSGLSWQWFSCPQLKCEHLLSHAHSHMRCMHMLNCCILFLVKIALSMALSVGLCSLARVSLWWCGCRYRRKPHASCGHCEDQDAKRGFFHFHCSGTAIIFLLCTSSFLLICLPLLITSHGFN